MNFYHGMTGERETKLYRALAFDPSHHKVVSFVGAGGKTTLLYELGRELSALGLRVIAATTTHMEKPQHGYREWSGTFSLQRGELCTVGVSCGDGKIKGKPEEMYRELMEVSDVLLIEADGSRRKPLKVPAAHEPVLLKETDLTVGVLGFQSVGCRICDMAHRSADVAAFLEKEETDVVTVEDLAKISFHTGGLQKGVVSDYRVIWNQWKGKEIPEKKYPVLLCGWEKMC